MSLSPPIYGSLITQGLNAIKLAASPQHTQYSLDDDYLPESPEDPVASVNSTSDRKNSFEHIEDINASISNYYGRFPRQEAVSILPSKPDISSFLGVSGNSSDSATFPPVVEISTTPLTVQGDSDVLPAKDVQRGFGNFIIIPGPCFVLKNPRNDWPPPPNKAYEDTTHVKKRISPNFKPTLDGLAHIKEQLRQKKELQRAALATTVSRSVDKKGSVKIKSSLIGEELIFDSQAPQKSMFADEHNIEWNMNMEYCNKCNKRHILPGAPINLQERDTCYSLLPEWFPQRQFDEPWQWFQNFVNEAVRLEEIEKGWAPDPRKPTWDKQYHEDSAAWRAVGRYGGWWKCRTGDQGKDISLVEKGCRLCHGEKQRCDELRVCADEVKRAEHAYKKEMIPKFIEDCQKRQMLRDRAFVEGRCI